MKQLITVHSGVVNNNVSGKLKLSIPQGITGEQLDKWKIENDKTLVQKCSEGKFPFWIEINV